MYIPAGTSLYSLGKSQSFVNILCKHGCGQTIGGIVGSVDDFIHGFELKQLLDRAKDLKAQ